MAWKPSIIVPIYKTGNYNKVMNYRGIQALYCLSKIFEKLVLNVLCNPVSSVISDNKHGFMKRRSTTTNTKCYVSALSHEVEQRCQVDLVYVDFAKTFDIVPHIVVVNEARYRPFNITSGVPQGNVLEEEEIHTVCAAQFPWNNSENIPIQIYED